MRFRPGSAARLAVVAAAAATVATCGGGDARQVLSTATPGLPVANSSPLVASPSPAQPSGFGPGDCTALPRGVKSEPAGDNFKVVIQVPEGWQQVPTGPTETVIFTLIPQGASTTATSAITAFSHIGNFVGRTSAQVAADSFKEDPTRVFVGQVTDCTVGGGPASYARYIRGSGTAGLQVYFLHQNFLYSLRLEAAAELESKAERDAKAVLGSWTWTDPPQSAGQQVPLLVNLSCRLPVRLDPAGPMGFLDLSTGRFTGDNTAPTSGSYSWAAARWLPVPYNQVAPDGLHYARVEAIGSDTTRVHVVDVSTGTDRVLIEGGPWYVRDYTRDGIYVEKRNRASNFGLWLLDPASGTTRQLLPDTVIGLALGGGGAWVEDVVSEGPSAKAVYRIDLATGVRTLWFSRSSPFAVYYTSAASGKPIVSWEPLGYGDHATELWLLSRPLEGTILYTGPHAAEPFPSGVVDANGVWFTGNSAASSLWLLTPANELRKIAAIQLEVLGSCH